MPRRGSAPGGRNRMAGASISFNPRGGVQYTWKGEKSLAMFQAVLDSAFATIKQRAENYWRNEEWTQERHPYMKGTERDSGFFLVQQTKSLRVEFRFGAMAPWTMYEEFGTARREGHHPIRNTLDRVGYRATDIIRDAARKVGLSGGSGGGSGLAAPTAHEGAGGHGRQGGNHQRLTFGQRYALRQREARAYRPPEEWARVLKHAKEVAEEDEESDTGVHGE